MFNVIYLCHAENYSEVIASFGCLDLAVRYRRDLIDNYGYLADDLIVAGAEEF